MEKLENKLKFKRIKIGILGGSFDPAHKHRPVFQVHLVQRDLKEDRADQA